MVYLVLRQSRTARANRARTDRRDGRYVQVKAAVRPDEHEIFYSLLAEVDGRHLSDIIRDALIELSIHYRLLSEDYE